MAKERLVSKKLWTGLQYMAKTERVTKNKASKKDAETPAVFS